MEQELIEIYEERAAIREFDGGLSRHEAEIAAYEDWRQIVGKKVPAPAVVQKTVFEARKLLTHAAK